MRTSVLMVAAALGMFCSSAYATTEMPAIFGARAAGMGGAGAAFTDDATAVFHNPAALDNIKLTSVVLDFSGLHSQLSVPFGDMETTGPGMSPLFFAGGAYRVHERVVVGLAAYMTAGTGAQWKFPDPLPANTPPSLMFYEPGSEFKASIGMMEIAVPVSVKLLDNLSLAAGWRVTYMMQSNEATMMMPVNPLDPSSGVVSVPTKADMSGVNFAGMMAGLYYKPLPMLQLGLTYRSKVTVDSSGTLKMGTEEYDAESSFSAPHYLRAGVAVSLLDERLLVAADYKYLMYKEANKEIETVTKMPGGDNTQTTPLNWKNAWTANLGVEYKVLPILAVRAGYSYSTSATPEETASITGVGPLGLNGVHLGAGTQIGNVDLDLAGFYYFGSGDVASATDDNAGVGEYSSSGLLGVLSANYHF